jgi:hypothetical protein
MRTALILLGLAWAGAAGAQTIVPDYSPPSPLSAEGQQQETRRKMTEWRRDHPNVRLPCPSPAASDLAPATVGAAKLEAAHNLCVRHRLNAGTICYGVDAAGADWSSCYAIEAQWAAAPGPAVEKADSKAERQRLDALIAGH